MIRTLWNGASGAAGHQARLDAAANNLANINTTGYKKQRVVFADLLTREMETSGRPVNLLPGSTARQGGGTAVVATCRGWEQGNVLETGRSLDLMIEGEGFFRLEKTGEEELYTRDGNFFLDAEGRLVNSAGYVLLDNLELTGAPDSLAISPNGLVTARDAGGELIELGQLTLCRFISPGNLEAAGENMFRPTTGSGAPVELVPGGEGAGMVRQGLLELSNVDTVEEMTGMIEAQRSYQFNLRSVRAADEMWGITNNLRR
jgi:flagellar basal-body rod protein FlgG